MVEHTRRRRTGDRRFFPRRKVCAFCVDKVAVIDYKDVARLRRYLTVWAKVEPRRKSGNCTPHQRALSVAIKRARYIGLLPFTGSHSLIELGRPEYPRGDRRFDRRERFSQAPVPAASAAPVAPPREAPAPVPAAVEPQPQAVEAPSTVAVPVEASLIETQAEPAAPAQEVSPAPRRRTTRA